MNPDELEAKHEENSQKIEQNKVSLDKVWAATFDWGSFFATPVGKALGGLALALLVMATTWVNDKINNPKNPVPPVNVNIVPVPDGQPPIIPPSAAKAKVTLYLTSSVKDIGNDVAVKALPVVIDPKIYDDGSKYEINRGSSLRLVPLPCAIAFGPDGKANGEGVTFANGADVAAFWKKVNP